jgi:diguanylate cyclase (GGDEF)-like protein
MRPTEFFRLRTLSGQDESALADQHGAEIQALLPLLGPLFGMAVILFGVWDYLIDPAHAPLTLAIRVLFVLAGSPAYTHTSAIILCEYLLNEGLLLGMAGIASCVFTVSVVTLRIRTFLLILAIPSMLFIVLGATKLAPFDFTNNLMLYIFAVALACTLMLVIRSFRQKAYLLEKELLHISRHDSLTGTYNRGYLIELAERELAAARRYGRKLAIAMIDIDHFKQINDTHGHHTGDEVIKQLVRTCTDNLREIDHFGRIGGEEFVCVLPEADEAEAMACAERLRRSIENVQIQGAHGPVRFTISIGVAVLDESHAGLNAMLEDADSAMYIAKNGGRNRVVLAPRHKK